MQSREKDNLIWVRLFPGEDVYEMLKQVCRQYEIKTAVIVSGLGQLADFELGFFKEKGNYLAERFSEPHELLCLTGNVSKQGNDYEFHLHAVLGNSRKQTVGGHFVGGRVSITAEIALLKTFLKVKRSTEEATGLRGLFLEK